MIGILLMLLTATVATVLGHTAVDGALCHRVRIPVRSLGGADEMNSAGDSE